MLRYLDKPNVDMRSVKEQLFVRKQDKVIFDFPWRTILKCGILPPIWCSVWRLLKRTSVFPRNTSCGFKLKAALYGESLCLLNTHASIVCGDTLALVNRWILVKYCLTFNNWIDDATPLCWQFSVSGLCGVWRTEIVFWETNSNISHSKDIHQKLATMKPYFSLHSVLLWGIWIFVVWTTDIVINCCLPYLTVSLLLIFMNIRLYFLNFGYVVILLSLRVTSVKFPSCYKVIFTFALCYGTIVCVSVMSCLSVTLVYSGQTVRRIKTKLGLATLC